MLLEHHLNFLIILLSSFLNHICQSQTFPASNTVYDYYPTYEVLYYMNSCVDYYCFSCETDPTECEMCFYGYSLVQNLCTLCPTQCSFCLESIKISDFPISCEDGRNYFYDSTNKNIGACMENCENCTSANSCDECKRSNYFTLSQTNNIVCSPCTISFCDSCYIANEAGNIVNLTEFPELTYDELNNKLSTGAWQEKCSSCADGYYEDFTASNTKCSLCNSTIIACLSCAAQNSEVLCSVCAEGKQLIFIDGKSECVCQIPNCGVCSSNILESKCLECNQNYVLNADNTSCVQCPNNCQKCIFDDGNAKCVTCAENYTMEIINTTTGTCREISESEQNNGCLNSFIYNSELYCQTCKNNGSYPDYSGICGKCGTYCNTCYQMYEGNLTLAAKNNNLTDYFMNDPFNSEILNFFNVFPYTTIPKLICSSCDTNSGYSLPISGATCCNVLSYIGCDTCSTCDSSQTCEKCYKCNNTLDNNLLLQDSVIANAEYKSYYYYKKIYYNLLEILSNENERSFLHLKTLYHHLKDVYLVNFEQSDIKRCVPCHIGAMGQCKISETYTTSSFADKIYSATELLPYYTSILNSQKCRPGFVKRGLLENDKVLLRCKYCPYGVRDCKTTKSFVVNLNKASATGHESSIYSQDIARLAETFVELSNNEFTLIMNEFFVEELKFIIYLEPGIIHAFTASKFRQVFYSPYLNNILSLQNLTIEFKPSDYDTNKLSFAQILLQTSFCLSEITNIVFYNIVFIYNNVYIIQGSMPGSSNTYIDLLSGAPGMLLEATNIEFLNCVFTYYGEQNTINSFAIIKINGEKVLFSNFTWKAKNFFGIIIESLSPLETLAYFEVQFSDTFKIENSHFLESLIQIKNLNLFYLNGKNFIIENLNILNIEINYGANFFNSLAIEAINIKNMTIRDCQWSNFTFFPSLETNNLIINLIKITNSSFRIDSSREALFNAKCINMFNVHLENCSFYDIILAKTSFVCEIPANLTFITYLRNSFIFKDDSLIILIDMNSFADKLYKCTIANFSAVDNEIKDISLLARSIYIFGFQYLKSIHIDIFLIKNSTFLSGLYIYLTEEIQISNFNIINYNILANYTQTAIRVFPLPYYVYIANIYLENIFNIENGILYMDSSEIDDVQRNILIKNLYSFNINLISLNVEVSSVLAIVSDDLFKLSMQNCAFLHIFMNDSSLYQLSTSALSIDSLISTLSINNSFFYNCTSTGNKNLIYFALNNFSIESCGFHFLNWFYPKYFTNFTKSYGSVGFIYFISYSSMVLSNVSNVYGYSGGVFDINTYEESDFFFLRCNFHNISVSSQGGIVYCIITEVSMPLKVSFTKSNFKNITAGIEGGILFAIGSNKEQFDFMWCIFEYIFANSSSIIYAEKISVSMSSSVFKNNIPENIDILTLYSTDKSTKMENSLFSFIQSSSFFKLCEFSYLYSYSLWNTIISINIGKTEWFDCEFTNITFTQSLFFFINVNSFFTANRFSNCSSPNIDNSDASFSPLIYQVEGSLILTDSFIDLINCSLCLTGGSFLYSKGEVFINSSEFRRCQSNQGGVLIINSYLETTKTNYITNCLFFNSSANSDGGCVYILRILGNLSIVNTTFEGCISNNYGGAINFIGINDETKNNNLVVSNCSFKNNRAKIGGAIFYQEIQIEISPDCTFFNNYANYYGENLFSYPRKMIIKNLNESNLVKDENGTLKYIDFRSGMSFPNISIQILDESDVPLKYIDNYTNPYISISIKGLSGQSIYSINNKKEINNISMETDSTYSLSDIQLIAKPNSTIALEITSDFIKTTNNTLQLESNVYKFTIYVFMRQCILGEIYINQSGVCIPCVANEEYSFNILDSKCKKCLKGLKCINPGAPLIEPGYWRDHIYSENIIPCENSPYNCIGGNLSRNEICAEGYIGAKCESCDIKQMFWNKSYSKNGLYLCRECKTSFINYIFLFFMSIMNFFLMAMAVKGSYNSIKISLQQKGVRAIAPYTLMPFKNTSESAIYIKIYLSYFQVMQVLSNIKLSLPSFIDFFTLGVGDPVFYVSNATDCILLQYFDISFSYIYLKLILVLLIPIFYLLLFGVGYFLYNYYRSNNDRMKFYLLYSVCLFSLFYFQPATVKFVINILTCVDISNQPYIKLDLAFFCETAEYYFYSVIVAIPALTMWAFLVPVILIWRIYTHRHSLNEIRVKLRYGYLYQEYKLYFWEFVRMYEKIFIIIFLEFYETHVVFKTLLVLMLIATYFVLVEKYKPYLFKNQNRIDKFTTIVCFLSIFCGLLIYVYPAIYVQVIGWGIIIFLNFYYNIFMLKLIFIQFSQVFEMIVNAIPFLKRYYKGKIKIYKTIHKWKTVRRLTAMYLREKYRRKHVENISSARHSYFNLELSDYDPNCVGAKRIKKLMKKDTTFDQKSPLRILDDSSALYSSTRLVNKKKNNLMKFITGALENLKFEEDS